MATGNPRRIRQARTLDATQYFNSEEARRLMASVLKVWRRDRRDFAKLKDAFLVDVGLSTGLRVAEMAALECRDLQVEGRAHSVVVRKGKGSKRRVVRVSQSFRRRCLAFLEVKGKNGEPTEPESPVFRSPVTGLALTRRALQKMFKRTAKRAGFDGTRSIHALRHTYGTQLCRATRNDLSLVKLQMGHESIRTTAVYLHVEDPYLDRAVERLSSQLEGRRKR